VTRSAEPLRIVHAIARLNLGGAAQQVIELAAGQTQRGHRAVIAAGRLAEGEESMDFLAHERGVPVVPVPELQRELSLRRDLAAARRVRRLLRAERPDVLHTHAAKAGAAGRLAAAVAGGARPSVRVHTFHGHVLRGYFGPRRERAFLAVERILARGTSALVAPSTEVRDDLVGLGVAPAARFEVIPYGFSFAGLGEGDGASVRRSLGLSEATFVVGWAGRLTAIKRPLDLVRVLAALVGRGVDAALVLVGDGPDRPAVEALGAELGVAGRVRLAGYRKEIADWHAAFDALLLTSANEGTPVAALEALASGRPVVATRVGGVPAVVEDAETGFLADVGDVEGLARGLEQLARDPEERRRMGAVGTERVRERFGRDRMVDDIEALYRRLLAR
jgi:glycosyltransferase involved in cell wall biosynthesis